VALRGSNFAVSSFASHVCTSFEKATTIVMMKAAPVHHFVVGLRLPNLQLLHHIFASVLKVPSLLGHYPGLSGAAGPSATPAPDLSLPGFRLAISDRRAWVCGVGCAFLVDMRSPLPPAAPGVPTLLIHPGGRRPYANRSGGRWWMSC
jgi:hypothetical protein